MEASNAGVEGTNRDRRATIRRVVYYTYGDAPVNLYYRSLQHAGLRRRQNRTVYAAVNLKQNLQS